MCAPRRAIFADQAQASLDAVARLRCGPNRFQGDSDAICRDWELDAPVSIRPGKLLCLLSLLCRRRAGRSSAGAACRRAARATAGLRRPERCAGPWPGSGPVVTVGRAQRTAVGTHFHSLSQPRPARRRRSVAAVPCGRGSRPGSAAAAVGAWIGSVSVLVDLQLHPHPILEVGPWIDTVIQPPCGSPVPPSKEPTPPPLPLLLPASKLMIQLPLQPSPTPFSTRPTVVTSPPPSAPPQSPAR